MAAKEANSSEAVIPINILGTPSAEGPRISRVTELSGDSALVTFGVEHRGPKVACRISKGKYWIEVIPLTGAEQLTIGIKARFVVLPTEFGEDQICDADDAIRRNISSAPLPHENMVIALEQEGNHMCIVTYPSIRQAGELTLGSRDSEGGTNRGSDAIATSLSANWAATASTSASFRKRTFGIHKSSPRNTVLRDIFRSPTSRCIRASGESLDESREVTGPRFTFPSFLIRTCSSSVVKAGPVNVSSIS